MAPGWETAVGAAVHAAVEAVEHAANGHVDLPGMRLAQGLQDSEEFGSGPAAEMDCFQPWREPD